MSTSSNQLTSSSRTRIESIDVIRGLTIMLMIFVNDVAGISNAPSWLKHVSASTDGMTLPDIVFPSFLFVMGMSIPIALSRRLSSGTSAFSALWHVFLRTASLLVIGVLMVNRPDDNLIGWPDEVWSLAMYLAVFAVWHTVRSENPRVRTVSVITRSIGAVSLLYLAAIFKGREGVWLQHSWWGILGLIGWAYLISSVIYIAVKDRKTVLIGAMSLLYCFYIAYREGKFGQLWLNSDAISSLPAIAVGGAIAGSLIIANDLDEIGKIRWALVFSGFMFMAGWLLRPLYGVNKIHATPSWCLWCSAIACATWAVLYYLIDVHGRKAPFRPIGAVGGNALFAYLVPSVLYPLFTITGIGYFSLGDGALAVGIIRSLVFAVAVSALSGWAGVKGLKLKL